MEIKKAPVLTIDVLEKCYILHGPAGRVRITSSLTAAVARQLKDDHIYYSQLTKQAREEVAALALQAIADEAELPGEMPDDLWLEIKDSKEKATRVYQEVVRKTKQDITKRFQSKLIGVKPPPEVKGGER